MDDQINVMCTIKGGLIATTFYCDYKKHENYAFILQILGYGYYILFNQQMI